MLAAGLMAAPAHASMIFFPNDTTYAGPLSAADDSVGNVAGADPGVTATLTGALTVGDRTIFNFGYDFSVTGNLVLAFSSASIGQNSFVAFGANRITIGNATAASFLAGTTKPSSASVNNTIDVNGFNVNFGDFIFNSITNDGATASELVVTSKGSVVGALTDGNASIGVRVRGSGLAALSNTGNAYTGGNIVEDPTGVLAGNSASLKGTIASAGTVWFVQNFDGAYDVGQITGSGNMRKSGGANLTLTGVSTYAGGISLEGGALTGTTDSIKGNVTSGASATGGNLVFDQPAAGTFAGDISGLVRLTKAGAGTVTLTGTNSYSGGTTVTAGALRGTTASLQGAITNDAAVIFDQPTQGTYAGAMAGTGTLQKLGAGTLTLAGANTYAGGTAVDAGTLRGTTTSLQGSIANNAELIFEQGFDGVYAGVLSGAGTFRKRGTGAVAFTGASPLSGSTFVEGGTLAVNGSLASSDVTVESGARLKGTGTVRGITARQGGSVAPGNSIGTLHAAGNVIFGAGSIYEVEVDAAGLSDLIDAAGTATISGGTVVTLASGGSFGPSTRYRILTAAGGRTGTFAGVTSNLMFLDATLDYDPNSVFLVLTRNDRTIASTGCTINQKSVGGGLDRLDGGGIAGSVLGLAADDLCGALESLTGSPHASQVTARFEESWLVREAILNRLRLSGRAIPPAFSMLERTAQAYAADAPHPVAAGRASSSGPVAWGQAFGQTGQNDGGGNAPALDRRTGGYVLGIDHDAGAWRAGIAGGYTLTALDTQSGLSSGHVDSIHVAAYGGLTWDGFDARFGAVYSGQRIEISRSVVFPSVAQRLRAAYDGDMGQAFGEIGYAIAMGTARLEPLANLAYVHAASDRFREEGGSAGLEGRAGLFGAGSSTLGLRARADAPFGPAGAATISGMLGWRHAFGPGSPKGRFAFLDSPGTVFPIAGVPIARNSLVSEAGIDWAVTPTASLGLAYAGTLAKAARDHALKGNLLVRF